MTSQHTLLSASRWRIFCSHSACLDDSNTSRSRRCLSSSCTHITHTSHHITFHNITLYHYHITKHHWHITSNHVTSHHMTENVRIGIQNDGQHTTCLQ